MTGIVLGKASDIAEHSLVRLLQIARQFLPSPWGKMERRQESRKGLSEAASCLLCQKIKTTVAAQNCINPKSLCELKPIPVNEIIVFLENSDGGWVMGDE
ncbi:MAG: hypothetical protein JXB07_14340 [Anaerolineae bacterium]|nr:hypothetical protein [Anaerolineae bacterium]